MKNDRQRKILDIVSSEDIETQEELMKALKREGYDTTQATVSRDIKELKLRKVSLGVGRRVYRPSGISADASSMESYKNILESSVLSVDTAGNLVVVKTVSGMAMAVGAAIDSLRIDGVVGCIAGDDTIFVAVKDLNHTAGVSKEIRGN
ncbi:MAG: arginine repressor [Eubacterium sp.]|nr:arginine repressor [Eubacterium sp.]